jgi:hypothetical protein
MSVRSGVIIILMSSLYYLGHSIYILNIDESIKVDFADPSEWKNV